MEANVRVGSWGLVLAVAACVPAAEPDGAGGDAPAAASTPTPTPTPRPTPVPDTEPEVPRDTGGGDRDGDGVRDLDDNCPDVENPLQADMDGDGEGNVCDDDGDGDNIPNERDLFPQDPQRPGRSSPDTVYPHGPGELYAFDVTSNRLRFIANFRFDRAAGSVTDVAIDRFGVLYAVTFTDAFVCHPDTAECWHIGALSGSYNGLTFVPPTVPGGYERLVGIANSGTWTQYDGVPFALTASPLGAYSGGYTSSGDVFYIEGTGTFGAVNGGPGGVTIVETTTTGQVLRTVASPPGTGGVYGLAGWNGVIYAFAASGAILRIDPATGDTQGVATGPSWWGAGVKTYVLTP